jgi:CBS domain-containing protein
MKTVKEILKGKKYTLLSCKPDATVYEALQTMAVYDIGALLVMEGDLLAGIFSERDYARKVILLGKSPTETRVSEIMTARVLWVDPETTAEECMAVMTDKHVRHLPVMDNSRVVGVISIGDVVKEVISEQQFAIQQLVQYITN